MPTFKFDNIKEKCSKFPLRGQSSKRTVLYINCVMLKYDIYRRFKSKGLGICKGYKSNYLIKGFEICPVEKLF